MTILLPFFFFIFKYLLTLMSLLLYSIHKLCPKFIKFIRICSECYFTCILFKQLDLVQFTNICILDSNIRINYFIILAASSLEDLKVRGKGIFLLPVGWSCHPSKIVINLHIIWKSKFNKAQFSRSALTWTEKVYLRVFSSHALTMYNY